MAQPSTVTQATLDKYLNKPTAAVHIRNSFTATERKLVNICLYEGVQNNFASETYAVDVQQTLNYLGCDRSKNSAWLKNKLFEALRVKPIRWNVLKKDSKLQEWTCSLLSGYIYEPESGKLAFQFNPMAVQQFKHRRLYSRLMLKIQAPIKSGHALTLYEFLNDALQHDSSTNVIRLSIWQLRELLDIDSNQYTEFKHLNQKALKPAFKEINMYTDIEASYVLLREKKRVIALNITAIRKNTLSKSKSLNTSFEDEAEPLSDETLLLVACGVTRNKALVMAEKYATVRIVLNTKYTLAEASNDRVKSLPSYLIKAVEKDYAGSEHAQAAVDLSSEWSAFRRERAFDYFDKLTDLGQNSLRQSYLNSIQDNRNSSIAREKFKYDGGWNSRYVVEDFYSKCMTELLKEPEELNIEAFKRFWPKHEIKKLLAERRKTVTN